MGKRAPRENNRLPLFRDDDATRVPVRAVATAARRQLRASRIPARRFPLGGPRSLFLSVREALFLIFLDRGWTKKIIAYCPIVPGCISSSFVLCLLNPSLKSFT